MHFFPLLFLLPTVLFPHSGLFPCPLFSVDRDFFIFVEMNFRDGRKYVSPPLLSLLAPPPSFSSSSHCQNTKFQESSFPTREKERIFFYTHVFFPFSGFPTFFNLGFFFIAPSQSLIESAAFLRTSCTTCNTLLQAAAKFKEQQKKNGHRRAGRSHMIFFFRKRRGELSLNQPLPCPGAEFEIVGAWMVQ